MRNKKKAVIFSIMILVLLAVFIIGDIYFLRSSAAKQKENKTENTELEEEETEELSKQKETEKDEPKEENKEQPGVTETPGAEQEEEKEEDTVQSIEGELPQAWDYVEEDNSPVVLAEKQLLDDKVPEEKLESLETEMLSFLKANGEYRREITVEEFSLEDSDGKVSFYGKFKNPRTDRKKIYSVYDKTSRTWEFSLQQEE